MERSSPSRSPARSNVFREHVRKGFSNHMRGAHVYGLEHLEITNEDFPRYLREIELHEEEKNREQMVRPRVSIFLSTYLLMKDDNSIEGKGWLHLMKLQELGINLECLSMNQNNFGPLECDYFTKMNTSKLTDIFLISNKVGDKGCEYLSKGRWDSLKEITLDDNNITEKGCEHLSKAIWNRLECLGLEQNPIGSQGYLYLKRHNDFFIECDEQYYDEPLIQNNPVLQAPQVIPPPAPQNNTRQG